MQAEHPPLASRGVGKLHDPLIARSQGRKASTNVVKSAQAEAPEPEDGPAGGKVFPRTVESLEDDSIRAQLRCLYRGDQALAGLAIDELLDGQRQAIVHPACARGTLQYEVTDGVVTLFGAVPDFVTRAYVGLLAWWIPGVRDVINAIALQHEEEEGRADKIAEAVSIALAMDPDIEAEEVGVDVSGHIVRLTGRLRDLMQRRKAKADALCVFGVDDVVDETEVRE